MSKCPLTLKHLKQIAGCCGDCVIALPATPRMLTIWSRKLLFARLRSRHVTLASRCDRGLCAWRSILAGTCFANESARATSGRGSLHRFRRTRRALRHTNHPRPSEESPAARYELMESVSFAFLLALEALTPSQRAVLLLRDVFDYSTTETAEALDLTEANAKVLLLRARRKMNELR